MVLDAQIDLQARKTPDAIALTDGARSITYRELSQLAGVVAEELNKRGVNRNDRVAVQMSRGLDFVIAIIGVLKARACCVPIDNSYPESRQAQMMADATVKFVVSDLPAQNKPKTLNVPAIQFESLINGSSVGEVCSPNEYVLDPNDAAFILFTSGSTGTASGVIVEHQNLSERFAELKEAIPTNENDVFIHLFPFVFIGGITSVFWPLLTGAKVVVPPKITDMQSLLDIVVAERVSVLRGTPLLIESFVDQQKGTELRSVRIAISTGQQLGLGTLKKVKTIKNCRQLFNVYGQTEGGASSIVKCYSLERTTDDFEISIGTPLSNTRAYILRSDGKLAMAGEVGEICLSGMSLARGYVNNDEKTQLKFIKNPFAEEKRFSRLYLTGDLGKWSPSGEIVCLGRNDDQIKIRGFRIEPGEIIKALKSEDFVEEAIVLPSQTEKQLQLWAYVKIKFDIVGGRDWRSILRGRLSAQLPSYMIPNALIEVQDFPLGMTGKLDKSRLPKPTRVDFGTNEFLAPRNEMEEKIVAAFAKVLGVSPNDIGVTDNYTRFGVDSFSILRILAELDGCGIEIKPTQLYSKNTIASLAMEAQRVSRQAETSDFEAKVFEIPPVYIQETLSKLRLSQAGKVMSCLVRPLHGEHLDSDRLEGAVQLLIKRHELLRSRLAKTATGELKVEVHPYQNRTALRRIKLDERDPQKIPEKLKRISHDLAEETDCIEPWPLTSALIESDDQQQWLFLAMTTTFADDMTIHVLLSELMAVYRGEALSQTTRYSDWVKSLQKYSTEQFNKERPFWENQMRKAKPIVPLPIAKGSEKRVGCYQLISDSWVDSLLSAERSGIVRFTDVMLAAFTRVVASYNNTVGLSVRISHHGRSAEAFGLNGVGHIVGPLSVRFPLYMEIDPVDNSMALLQTRRHLESVPNMGAGFWGFEQLAEGWKSRPPELFHGVPAVFVFEGRHDFRGYGWEAPFPDEALMAGNERSVRLGEKESALLPELTPEIRYIWGDPTLRSALVYSEKKWWLKLRFVSFASMSSELKLAQLLKMYIKEMESWASWAQQIDSRADERLKNVLVPRTKT